MSAKRAAERMKWMQNKKIDDEDVEPGIFGHVWSGSCASIICMFVTFD